MKQLEELLTSKAETFFVASFRYHLFSEEGKKKFEQEYGHGEAKMDETFWMAGTMFSAQGMKEGTKRVFLLTNNDKPHKNEADLRVRRAAFLTPSVHLILNSGLSEACDPKDSRFTGSRYRCRNYCGGQS